MSEVNPLVQRVDALLKRHQQKLADAQVDSGEKPSWTPTVDVQADRPSADNGDPEPLTDVAADPPPQPQALPDPPPAEIEDDIPVLTEIVDTTVAPAAVRGLEDAARVAEIQAAVLEKLLTELDRALDQRLGRTIGDLLDQVLHGLRADLSVGVREMVREAVAAAVSKAVAAQRPPEP